MPDHPLDPAEQDRQDRENMRGMAWMVVSVLAASVMIVSVRMASVEVSSAMVVFLRAAIALVVALPVVALVPRARRNLRFSRPWLHVARGCLIGGATQFGFYSISVIPLATASALFLTGPIFATLFNIYLHKERVGPRRIIASAIGFIGALVVLRPDLDGVELGMFTALMSSILFGATLSLSRNVTRADGAFSAYISSIFFTVLVAVPLVAGEFQMPGLTLTWIAVGIVVVTSFVRNIADILAYHWAEAGVLITLSYTRLVLVAILAYFLFDEVPDLATIIGAAIIVASTLYIAQRQAALKRRAVRAARDG